MNYGLKSFNEVELWAALDEKFPPQAYEEDSRGSRTYVGVSVQYVVERMTQVFGPCGVGWKFSIIDWRINEMVQEGRSQREAQVLLEVSYETGTGWSEPIPSFGASQVSGNGVGDALKGATADALKKALSFLGLAMHVYRGEGREAMGGREVGGVSSREADASDGEGYNRELYVESLSVPFGPWSKKHSGKTVGQVYSQDIGYVKWYATVDRPQDARLAAACRYVVRYAAEHE